MNVVVDLSMSILTENIQLQFRETVACPKHAPQGVVHLRTHHSQGLCNSC